MGNPIGGYPEQTEYSRFLHAVKGFLPIFSNKNEGFLGDWFWDKIKGKKATYQNTWLFFIWDIAITLSFMQLMWQAY